MSNHTKAPWTVEMPLPDDIDQMPVVLGHNDSEPVCEILGPLDNEDGLDRGHFDMVLIAAAPELLAACEAALTLESAIDQEAWYASSHCPDVIRQLQAAIAKATGNTAFPFVPKE